jgi:Cdc6-like AAA superfamily ATPase
VFNKDSLNFVAMKIGNYSGDIRRVLMITKRAVEIARETYQERNGKNKGKLVQVNSGTVNQAFNELYKSKTV